MLGEAMVLLADGPPGGSAGGNHRAAGAQAEAVLRAARAWAADNGVELGLMGGGGYGNGGGGYFDGGGGGYGGEY